MEKLNKPTVIIGAQGSGKTTKAIEIASKYNKDEVVVIPYDKRQPQSPFLLSDCTPKTKLIIFDEIPKWYGVQAIWREIKYEICVIKKYHVPFEIQPEVVFCVHDDVDKVDLTIFTNGYTLIQC